MRNLQTPNRSNEVNALSVELNSFIQLMTVTDWESIDEGIFRFLPYHLEDNMIRILKAIQENRTGDLISEDVSLSKIFTTEIPDLLWKHIELTGYEDWVKFSFKDYDWMILGRLSCRNECTMHIFGNQSRETVNGRTQTLFFKDEIPEDIQGYFKAVRNGEINAILSHWSEMPEPELPIYQSAFLADPFDESNKLGIAIKKRFPSVYESYRSNWEVWRGNLKCEDATVPYLYIIPDFHSMVRDMIIEMVYMHIHYELPGVPVGISKNGFIVPKEHYTTLVNKCIKPTFEQLLYDHPVIKAEYV